MSRPGRKQLTQPGFAGKKELSSDAKIIVALVKKQPQNRDELCQNAAVNLKTFYRISSFLQEKGIIKCINGVYALKEFDFLEKQIEDALIRFTTGNFCTPGLLANEVGRPWPTIQALTYKIAKKLGLTITGSGSDTLILKTG
jgi:hypothetical protein